MQIPELAARLQTLGLSDKQSKVYVAALFLGPSAVQKIAEQSGINRATTYLILDELAELGLVSQTTQNGKTVFVAEGPERINAWLEGQELAIKAKRVELEKIHDDLILNARGSATSAPIVRFFKGSEGASNIQGYLRRKARPKSTIYALSNVDELIRFMPDIITQNPTARLKKQLASKLLYSYSAGTLDSSDKLLRETKKVKDPVAADINVYEEGVSISTYEGSQSIEILIESADVARALRQLFELAWENLDSNKNVN